MPIVQLGNSSYTLWLITFNDGGTTFAQAVNSNGDVAGYAIYTPNVVDIGSASAFLWRFSENRILDIGPTLELQLGEALAKIDVTYTSSAALGVKDARQVVGAINYEESRLGVVFLYDNLTGKASLLGSLPDGANSVARVINNNGTVVGNADRPFGGGTVMVPFFFKNGSMQQIGTPIAAAGISGFARGISQLNSNGQEFIVGNMSGLSPEGDGAFYVSLSGTDLGPVSIIPNSTTAFSVNTSGEVVYVWQLPPNTIGNNHLNIYDIASSSDEYKSLVPVDDPEQLFPLAINEGSQVVGSVSESNFYWIEL